MALEEGKIVNGNKVGVWTVYYANGNKRSVGSYEAGVRVGKWVYYYPNGNKEREGTFRNGLYEGLYTSYHRNGNKNYEGMYGPHRGKSTDGKKEGVWSSFSEDGESVWRLITYKRGARAKPDEYPLGLCSMCREPLKDPDSDLCVACRKE